MCDIIFYGYWHIPYQRPHHFVRLFKLRGVMTCVLTRMRISGKSPSVFKHYNECSSPNYIRVFPLQSRFPKKISHAFIKWQERKAFHKLADNIPAIIYTIPMAIPEKANPLVFDCIDDFAAFGRSRDKNRERLQYKIAKKSDVIWATSKKLYELLHSEFPEKTHFIPNGSDVNHFSIAIGFSPEVNRALLAGKRALVGYCGAISSWFDFKLLIDVSKRLSDVQFVLVGPIYTKVSKAWPENITVLGAQPYSKLPWILKECDCCIIPFVLNDLTNATNPIKLYEYFAAGKPVVSTPLIEVERFKSNGILETAGTADEFAMAIERSINTSWSKDKIKRRLMIAKENSWEARFETAFKSIIPFLPDGWPNNYQNAKSHNI